MFVLAVQWCPLVTFMDKKKRFVAIIYTTRGSGSYDVAKNQ